MARNSLLVDQWRAALGLDYITENLDSVVNRVKEIQDRLEELGRSTEFIGVSTTDPVTGVVTIGGEVKTPERGNIVIYGFSEYIYNGDTWQEFGDETLYVLKAEANYTDLLEDHKFITSVNEVEGVISVTKSQPVIGDVEGLTERLDSIESEIEKLESTDPGETESIQGMITTAINGLDVNDESVSHQFVTSVSEVDGKISVTRSQPAIDDVEGLPIRLLNLGDKDAELSRDKADKVTRAVADNFAGLDANGNLIDSGKSASSFDPAGTAQSLVNTLDRGATSDDTIHRNPFIKDIIQVDGKITEVRRGNALDAEQEPIITESQVKDLVTDLTNIRSSITSLDNSKVSKDDVDSALSEKADKSYVDTELAKKVNNDSFTSEVGRINDALDHIEGNYVGGLDRAGGTPITITELTSSPKDHRVYELGFSIDTSDKVLTQSDNGLKTNLGLRYNTDDTTVELLGVNGHVISSFNASAFIKDGLLDSAVLVTDPDGHPAGKYIKLVFNTDSEKDDIFIDVTSLIDIYTAGNGLELSNKSFSIKIDADSSRALTVGNSGLKLVVDEVASSESSNPIASKVVADLQSQVNELSDLVNVLTQQLTFNVDNIDALDDTSTNSVNVD